MSLKIINNNSVRQTTYEFANLSYFISFSSPPISLRCLLLEVETKLE